MYGSKQQLIQQFREEKYGIQQDGIVSPAFRRIFADLTNAVEQLSTGLYEKDVHFLMELIQNAEDNQYAQGTEPQLKFVLLDNDPTHTPNSDGCLCVFNNEIGFQQVNIESISGVGQSTKKKYDGYIGEKGIGFKSVFIVSMSPHIFSNGYQIRFLEKDDKINLNYIVPYWVEQIPDIVKREGMMTALLLPLKPGKKAEIVKYLQAIKPESILFLKKIKRLHIEIAGAEHTIEMAVSRQKNSVIELTTSGQAKASKSRYWIYSQTVSTPSDLKEDKREGITEREITLAFPLDKDGVRGKVFAYLPTEVDSGFPFIINSDFLLTANRESFQSDRQWNQWLKNEIGNVIVNALDAMRLQSQYKKAFYGYIPLKDDIRSLPEYFIPIAESVIHVLTTKPLVLTMQGELFKACDTRFASKEERELFIGKQLPAWLQTTCFVDVELEKFAKQLKAIGTKDINKTELPLILDDKGWLDQKQESWFISLFQYLSKEKYTKKILEDKFILPVEGNKKKRSTDGVYYSRNHELIKSIPDDLSIEVFFISDLVFEKNALSKYLTDSGLIEFFSAESFILKTVLPMMKQRLYQDGGLPIVNFLQFSLFVFKNFEALSDSAKSKIKSDLFLLLDKEPCNTSGNLISNGFQILYPAGYYSETGWSLFFDKKLDCDRCAVLSDEYLKIAGHIGTGAFETILGFLGATKYPKTKKVTYNSYSSEIYRNIYARNIFYQYAGRETNYTVRQLITHVAPCCFKDAMFSKNSKVSFVKWLEYHLLSHSRFSDGIFNGEYKYQYRGINTISIESEFAYLLRNTNWINTQLGKKKPSEVFVKTPPTLEMFGNSLPYLEDNFSERLRQFLGVKENAGSSDLLRLLVEYSTERKITDVKLARKIYSYLYKNIVDSSIYKESFQKNSLVYIPEGRWLSLDEVIWDDASSIIGDAFGWLSSVYPDELEEFFVRKLGIKKNIDNAAYIDAWLAFQESKDKSDEEVESFLSKAIPQIIKLISDDPEHEKLESFKTEAKVWTQDKTWENASNVFLPDDEKLKSLFGDNFYFTWRIPEKTFSYMSKLFDFLEVESISETVFYELEDVSSSKKRNNKLLTNYSVRLLADLIHNDDSNDEGILDGLLNNGTFKTLFCINEILTDKLVVSATVSSESISFDVEDCFLDFDQYALYLNESSDDDYVLDELARILKRFLFGNRDKKYEDSIRALLGVKKKERYLKLRTDRNWHLPQSLRDKLNEVEKLASSAQVSKKPVADSETKTQDEKPQPQPQPEIVPKESAESISKKYNENKNISGSVGQKSTVDSGNQAKLNAGNDTDNKPKKPILTLNRNPNSANKTSGASSTQHNARSRSTVGKSKSNKTNNIRRGRIITYVSKERESEQISNTNLNANNKALGNQAEAIVLNDLSAKGFDVTQMQTNNKGYDIEAVNPISGEIFYVEVKGNFGIWSEKGVGISKSQYQFAAEYRENFILAVVDNLAFHPNQPVYIQNPVSSITEYRFDHGWEALKVNLTVEANDTHALSPVEERISLTDSTICKAMIKYCDENGLPIPEVGVELLDNNGAVVYESLELCWEEEHIGVVLNEEDLEYAQALTTGWTFAVAKDLDVMKDWLNNNLRN